MYRILRRPNDAVEPRLERVFFILMANSRARQSPVVPRVKTGKFSEVNTDLRAIVPSRGFNDDRK
jgi:hypothetical protein